MKPADKQTLLDGYHRSLAQHGDTAEAVHWRESTQRARFDDLVKIAELTDASVLDYGCGKGDLYAYLKDRGFRGRYTGFDINPEMIALARKKHPGVRFEACDIEEAAVTERFDYILLSGVFNNRISDNQSWMQSVLRKCFAIADKGLGFNAISTYVNYREEPLYYADPEEMVGGVTAFEDATGKNTMGLPPLTPFQGILFRDHGGMKLPARESLEKKISAALIAALEHTYRNITLALHYTFEDIRPFYFRTF